MARPNYEAKWRERLARWKRSGTTVAEFCRGEGVSKCTFYGWRRRLGVEDSSPPVEFIEVAQPTTASVIELELSNVVVRVPSGFAADDLRSVLAVLGWSPR